MSFLNSRNESAGRDSRAGRAGTSDQQPDIVVLSRQRLVGRTNGSSTYLLDICAELAKSGRRLTLVSPSPTTFGRWPVLPYKAEMRIFSKIKQRGGIRIGDVMIATDPTIALNLLMLAVERVCLALKLVSKKWLLPAPYAVAAPELPADQRYVSRHAKGAKAIIVDYAFLTPLLSYVDSPGARSVVVMHDLFSSRQAQFEREGGADSVASITSAREFELLDGADVVAAIQYTEADVVRQALPTKRVLTVPLAVKVVEQSQPGRDDKLLFIGSNTAPNVLGLEWFFENVWPEIKTLRPGAELDVVGNVSRSIGHAPNGVKLHGLVESLDEVYRDAGVVISPLTVGSGLKIKVIEALAHGKAMVGTSVALQGIETQLEGAVVREDDPVGFARETARLLADSALRTALGEAARSCAVREFSAEKCYGELCRFIEGAD